MIDRSLYLPFEDAAIACDARCGCGCQPGSCRCDTAPSDFEEDEPRFNLHNRKNLPVRRAAA